jgi:hypothetical protein
MSKTLVLLVAAGFMASANAAIVQLNLSGKAGDGLLSGNENGVVTGGLFTGGESGSGIFYDDVSNLLTINLSWATALGFTGLSGNATAAHIHGPTPSSGSAAFNENVGVLFSLSSGVTWDANATTGGVTARTITLTEPQEFQLLAGRYYINVHTATNPAGEIRGNIVIPEPSMAVLSLLGCAGMFVRRRRR